MVEGGVNVSSCQNWSSLQYLRSALISWLVIWMDIGQTGNNMDLIMKWFGHTWYGWTTGDNMVLKTKWFGHTVIWMDNMDLEMKWLGLMVIWIDNWWQRELGNEMIWTWFGHMVFWTDNWWQRGLGNEIIWTCFAHMMIWMEIVKEKSDENSYCFLLIWIIFYFRSSNIDLIIIRVK